MIQVDGVTLNRLNPADPSPPVHPWILPHPWILSHPWILYPPLHTLNILRSGLEGADSVVINMAGQEVDDALADSQVGAPQAEVNSAPPSSSWHPWA